MSLLVTGATGFIGSGVYNRAYRLGMAPRGSSRTSDRMVKASLDPLMDWSTALHGCDVVIHTAARVHVMQERAQDPLAEFRRVNVAGTLNLARQAADGGVQRFVFLSSIKVNGEMTPIGQPFTASQAAAPLDPYGVSKAEAEEGLRHLGAETGMEIVIIRPPLVYGPGVKANFGRLVSAIGRGWPLPLGCVEHNRRSLVALDNLVDLLITCIDHPAAVNQTFLVSDGEDLSTADLLHRLGQVMDKPARLFPVPPSLLQLGANLLGKGDMAQRLLGNLQIDISHTRNTLKWAPPISVDEGLRRVVGLAP